MPSLSTFLLAIALFPLFCIATPRFIPCEADTMIRSAGPPSNQTLSAEETDYIASRRSAFASSAYISYLHNVVAASSAANVAVPGYVSSILSSCDVSALPRLGIAASGGGYRATFVGAGELNALDGRNTTSSSVGTGGLLQAADYLTGLSGGSWLVTSMSQAGFPTIRELAFGIGEWGGWNAMFDFTDPANNSTSQFLLSGENMTDANDLFIERIMDVVAEKFEAGFPVSFADVWAVNLAYHFVNGTTPDDFFNSSLPHGMDLTLSGLMMVPSLQSFTQPFPILTILTESPNENMSNIETGETVPLTNTQYEVTPIEFGSFDASLSSFVPTHLLGTHFSSGTPMNVSQCARAFDTAAFLFGASSNVFPEYNVTTAYFFSESDVAALATLVNETFFEGGDQVGLQVDTANMPNPFKGLGDGTYLDTNETILRMVDGGNGGEVTPYAPLISKARRLDVIIGLDNDAHTSENYTAGLSLSSTFNRSLLVPDYNFPVIPLPETIVEEGLNLHPTFFGCNDTRGVPIIVYVPNSPPADGSIGVTNTTTAQTLYTSTQVESILDAASELIYRGFPQNGTLRDPAFPACLACAIVDRTRARMGIERDGVCGECFARYCWFP